MSLRKQCNHLECVRKVVIDSASQCGGFFTSDLWCEEHYCSAHLSKMIETINGDMFPICDDCVKKLLLLSEWIYDDERECLVHFDNWMS